MLVRALAPARLVLRNSRMFSSASTKADGLSNSRIAQLRGMSTKADGLSSLSVGELKRLLGARGVDFKDCLEKGELMSRVRDSESAALRANTSPSITSGEQRVISTFQRVSPSVAYIRSMQLGRDPLTMRSMEVPAGAGSGFLWDDTGHVVTNYHVVASALGHSVGGGRGGAPKAPPGGGGARGVHVTLQGAAPQAAEIVGFEPEKDLAVLKIPSAALPPPIEISSSADLAVGQTVLAIGNPFGLDYTLTTGVVSALGRSDELQVGDWVIAIGNAVGLDSTVTLGIVSSLSRSSAEVGIPNKKVNFIQTDAAINPGNSGGPLLNEFGEVIGVNTAIRANAAGIGFAIPIDTADKAMRELAQGKKIAHAYLGISMSSLTPDSARQNNADPNSNVELPEQSGALILAVAPDTPAAKAGLRKFDLITELAGQTVKSAADAQAIVDNSRVGQSLVCKVVRGQKTIAVAVTTSDLSDRPTK